MLFRSSFYNYLNIYSLLRIHEANVIVYDVEQEIYWSMASALSEADGIDYTDPEEVKIPCS